MNTKTNPNGHRVVAVWVRFGVQLGLRQTPALIKSAKNTKKQKNNYTVCRVRQITFFLGAVIEPVRHDPGHAAFFMTCEIELNTKNSTRRQQSCLLVEFLVFNSAFGRHRQ